MQTYIPQSYTFENLNEHMFIKEVTMHAVLEKMRLYDVMIWNDINGSQNLYLLLSSYSGFRS